MKRSNFFALILLLPLLIVGGVRLYFVSMPTISQEKGMVYYLRPNLSKKVLITELTQQGILNAPFLFTLNTFLANSNQLKSGEYLFPRGATQATIWRQITTGSGLMYHPFTIIPGWSFKDLRAALDKVEGLRHLTTTWDDQKIMAYLNNENLAPQGEFFPETYYYTRNISDLVILKRAFDLMQTKLKEAWETRAPDLPYKDAYQALIVASLIEKEAFLDSERPTIAGVILNRLKKEMFLQIDASVIFGLGDRYAGKIYKADLLDKNSYNTYLYKGLPPTPIAMPGLVSINAAMHPEKNDYYYYVSRGDGSHQFSKTLKEHHNATTKVVKHEAYSNNIKASFYLQKIFSLPAVSI